MMPTFSIVIPTYNRHSQLARCLTAIAALDYERSAFEVLVVDDGSETSPDYVTDSFRGHMDVTLIRQVNAGPAAARNHGAAQATGVYLAFTDDDCEPSPQWLRELEDTFRSNAELLLGGQTVNALPGNACAVASHLLVEYLYEYFDGTEAKTLFFATNNMAVSRKLFMQIGGFAEGFPLAGGEDREFCDRWHDAGYSGLRVQGTTVSHAHPLTLRSFIRQHGNYGRGALHFRQARKRRSDSSVTVEPLSFYTSLLMLPFDKSQVLKRRWVLAFLLGISQVCNVLGFVREAVRARMSAARSTG